MISLSNSGTLLSALALAGNGVLVAGNKESGSHEVKGFVMSPVAG